MFQVLQPAGIDDRGISNQNARLDVAYSAGDKAELKRLSSKFAEFQLWEVHLRCLELREDLNEKPLFWVQNHQLRPHVVEVQKLLLHPINHQ